MSNDLVVATAENEKVLLTIEYDNSAESPREWDNLGTMICFSRRSNLGDEHSYNDPSHFLESLAGDLSMMDTDKLEDLTDEKLMEVIERYAIILPVYKYEHSGICLNTTGYSCRWDSGQVGWIYITKKHVRQEYSAKRVTKKIREKAENALRGEVEIYSQYVEGSVFGYILEDKETGEEIDSCWGFFGYDYLTNGMAENMSEEYVPLLKEVS
jgi:hypothetical protein